MSEYIPTKLRSFVSLRADDSCEYCLIPALFSFFKFHLDHIISLKHGGKTKAENLANSCSICNENKGSDIATFIDTPNNLVRFFNPRIDNWKDHFRLDISGEIIAKTDIGKATMKIFKFNNIESIIERKGLIEKGWFKNIF